jgi:hypothetical protein
VKWNDRNNKDDLAGGTFGAGSTEATGLSSSTTHLRRDPKKGRLRKGRGRAAANLTIGKVALGPVHEARPANHAKLIANAWPSPFTPPAR